MARRVVAVRMLRRRPKSLRPSSDTPTRGPAGPLSASTSALWLSRNVGHGRRRTICTASFTGIFGSGKRSTGVSGANPALARRKFRDGTSIFMHVSRWDRCSRVGRRRPNSYDRSDSAEMPERSANATRLNPRRSRASRSFVFQSGIAHVSSPTRARLSNQRTASHAPWTNARRTPTVVSRQRPPAKPYTQMEISEPTSGGGARSTV